MPDDTTTPMQGFISPSGRVAIRALLKGGLTELVVYQDQVPVRRFERTADESKLVTLATAAVVLGTDLEAALMVKPS